MDPTMAAFRVIFFIFINSQLSLSYHLGEEKVLLLPTEYHIKGEIADLVTGLDQPFEAWYSEEKNKSRIDVYDGLVKTYYADDEDMSIEYKVHPATTEEVTNEIRCSKDYVEDPPKLLPTNDSFTHTGEEVYNSRVVQVWTFLEVDLEKKTKDVIYVYRNEDGIDVPVWRERKVFNEWTGVTSKHSIILYFDFKVPNEEELDVTKVKECEDDATTPPRNRWSDEDIHFHGYKLKHGRNYKRDEHAMRKSIFEKNLKHVIEHNKQNLGYKLTINKFSDRTDAELAYLMGTRPSDHLAFGSEAFPHSEKEVNEIVQSLPEEYDMRVDGVISVIKNQARCGSCWSFATVAAVEGALARGNGGRMLDLSEQSLVDCSWGFSNEGCNGGFISETFQYVLKHGIPVESDYGTYLAADGRCNLKNMSNIYNIKGFSRVPPMSVNAMKVALYKYGPVTVTINSHPLVKYSSGVFYDLDCNRSPINHAVTVVGYGKRNGATYWIIKNSWGEDWGQDGYVLLSSLNNNCHLLENGFYPII